MKSDSKYESQVPRPKKEGGMYPMKWPPYDNVDVEDRVANVLGPLSLFAPYPHENVAEEPVIQLERPVTPINDEIRALPSSYDQLAGYVRRRIKMEQDAPYLTVDDQRNLAGVIMGEVNGIWPEIRKQIDDPFLSPSENKELNRRIAVHIVTVCQHLFEHYLRKAQILNERGIFSGPANMSRLKAQLALDTNKFLNILKIRRYIVQDIRGKQDDNSDSDDGVSHISFGHSKTSDQVKPPRPLSYKQLIQSSRPKSRSSRVKFKGVEKEIQELRKKMPTLDTSKLMNLIADLPERDLQTPSDDDDETCATHQSQHRASAVTKERSFQRFCLKKSNSLPQLQFGESLMDELGVDPAIKEDKLSKHELDMLKKESMKTKSNDNEKELQKPEGQELIRDDLRKLLSQTDNADKDQDDEELPPLLQAITRSAQHDGLKAKLEQELMQLEEKERNDIVAQKIEIKQPSHVQPATVKTKFPNQMLAKTSDVRVSERVCMSTITLNRYATVYNELLEETDPATLKQLDRNLYLGQEIRDVYKEIMKTVSHDHLELDQDDLVSPAATDIDVSGTMASGTLSKKKGDRIINPAFIKEKDPPWGNLPIKEWVKTPQDPPKNFLGQDVFQPLTPDIEKIQKLVQSPVKMGNQLTSDHVPSFVAEKMSRTYASWLQWWKGTITSDDYMKYLSTQETDYMGALFHFYDSDEEEDDGNLDPFSKASSRSTSYSKKAEHKEREKKIEEMKTQKAEFVPGFWNANSVFMGGLGKDPKPYDAEEEKTSRTTKSIETSRSTRTLAEKAEQTKASKQLAVPDESASRRVMSRLSRVTGLTMSGHSPVTRSPQSNIQEQTQNAQERLELIWVVLQMPDNLKLDMAIKYSCQESYEKLDEAIDSWERAAELVWRREDILMKLEKFERGASDPNRFFEKGQKGSSAARLNEAKKRSYYYKQIEELEGDLKPELDDIMKNYGDTVTFRGRPYTDKMKWDRIEMLYWLGEERKEHGLKYEALHNELGLKYAQLEPIPAVSSSSIKSIPVAL